MSDNSPHTNEALNISKADSLEQIAEQQNHYVVHLAEVNKNSDVLSTQDIYNANGLLVVKKDTNISHSIAERILQHKLMKPLEEQIQLQNSLSSEKLSQDTTVLLEKYPDLLQVHSAYGFQKTLDLILRNYGTNPIVIQKLTVMRERLPKEYEKSLFCAWLSSLIATEARMQEDLIRSAYFAGLTHDVGLLHISENILNKQETLTPNEWRAIQCHVIVGYMLLKNLEKANPLAARAVMEHHERCDGGGYPLGKTDEELDLLGQVTGMADSLQAIRINQFSKCGRNLRDAMPYLHMNSQVHFLVTYKAMCSILQKSGLQPSHANPLADVKSLVSHLLDHGKKLQKAVVLLEQVSSLAVGEGISAKKIVKVVKPVVTMIQSSGLMKKEIFNWLETLHDDIDKIVMDELLEMELMQNELYWQLKSVCKVVNEYLDAKEFVIAPEIKEQLVNIVGQIRALLQV
jgi:HD-GYP domain-containing protein (c-di-GMP phosphodiesterase class II)